MCHLLLIRPPIFHILICPPTFHKILVDVSEKEKQRFTHFIVEQFCAKTWCHTLHICLYVLLSLLITYLLVIHPPTACHTAFVSTSGIKEKLIIWHHTLSIFWHNYVWYYKFPRYSKKNMIKPVLTLISSDFAHLINTFFNPSIASWTEWLLHGNQYHDTYTQDLDKRLLHVYPSLLRYAKFRQ